MKKAMTWYDVDDILYEGTKEEITALVCSDCGHKIRYRYSDEPRGFEVSCKSCGYISRSVGGPKPKCVNYFGYEYNWR